MGIIIVLTGVEQRKDEKEVEREADEVTDGSLRDCPHRVTLHDELMMVIKVTDDSSLKGDNFISPETHDCIQQLPDGKRLSS